MGDYSIYNRIAPAIRWNRFEIGGVGAAWTQVMPENPNRFALAYTYLANDGYYMQFSKETPSAISGSLFWYGSMAYNRFCYCDWGDLVQWPIWWYLAIGPVHTLVMYEGILPAEAWRHIKQESIGLPGIMRP